MRPKWRYLAIKTKQNKPYQHKFLKHSGGGVIIWACFTAARPGHLAVTELTMNFSVYQNVGIYLTAKSMSKM